MSSSHNFIVALIGGVLYVIAVTVAVGFLAAVASPEWFIEFAGENSSLAVFLRSLTTTAIIVVVTSAGFGLLVSRFIDDQYLATGILTVLLGMLATASVNFSLSGNYMMFYHAFVPVGWQQLPTHLALYLSLPFFTWYFGKKRSTG